MKTVIKQTSVTHQTVMNLATGLECHPVVATLLANRGISTVKQAQDFINPRLESLTDPFALKDMDRAVDRIHTAILNRERIMIFGDFDADGVTATVVLTDFFNAIEAENTWYVPHRVNEGYSLKPAHISMAADRHTDLIITVDCGSDSHEAVKAAAKEDIDIIITDHHEIRDPIPEAVAVINPKRNDCHSGLDYLAGVGVAFYLVIALRRHFRINHFWEERAEPNLKTYCDLVTLGTIADMVPLIRENRVFCHAGLPVIRQGLRPGFRAIAETGKLSLPFIDSDDISYRIAPRINAAGRVSHSRICVSLLTAQTISEAEQTAAILEDLNIKRQQTEQAIVTDIEARLARDASLLDRPALVLWDADWNPGVLGIAASRTAKRHNRPVVLISTAGSPATGSCRSIAPYNVHRALEETSQFLKSFGGHVMAAGLALDASELQDFSLAFDKAIENQVPDRPEVKTVSIDAYLTIDDISTSLVMDIDTLRPFGTGNPEPLFAMTDVRVASSTIIGGKHRKMLLAHTSSPDGPFVEALHFNRDVETGLPDRFDTIAFKLKINRYQNRITPQIIIEHTSFLA